MDSLRDHYGEAAPHPGAVADYPHAALTREREDVAEAPPPAIGRDERRMQVRAYNFWASLLADRNFPAITDLDPAARDDFGPNSVLLDFSADDEDPRIAYLGSALADECDAGGLAIRRLSDVPSRSLLSRITDHYLQIIANQAPIGFEAEFINQRGATILYRGILLPFSSDDRQIDFIYGVINWKELADQQTTDELMLEIDQVLEAGPAPRRAEPAPIADWADAPGAAPASHAPMAAYADFEPLVEDAAWIEATPPAGDDDILDLSTLSGAVALASADAPSLADLLADAREQAVTARDSEHRSRGALYQAIGRAWDFAVAAGQAPEEFAEMLADAGLPRQDRAPMTPVVKLVFGADYDKTRLTEYAAALTHAQRIGLAPGQLAAFLEDAEGGLKGVVAAERRCRRADAGQPLRPQRSQPRAGLARRLRALPAQSLATLDPVGAEFALVLVRRDGAGEALLLGELRADAALLDKAARQLLG